MSEEEIKDIKELIERKIFLAEVSGGLTYSDNKFIDLWNYTIDLKEENSQLKEDIKGLQCERKTLYNTIYDLKKANKQLNRKIDRGINKIEKAQKLIEVPTYPENIYLGFCYLFGKYNYDELPSKIKEALK